MNAFPQRMIVWVALAASGCALARPPAPAPEKDSTGYLVGGATTAPDVLARAERQTTLEALHSTTALLDRERAERQRVEKELVEEKVRVEDRRRDVERLQAELDVVRRALEESQATAADLSRRLLDARIERVRIEQELVKLQIAALKREASPASGEPGRQ